MRLSFCFQRTFLITLQELTRKSLKNKLSKKSSAMQVFLTIITGVLVFVVSQLLLKLVIEPVQQLKRVISNISFALILYANVWPVAGLPLEEDKEIEKIYNEFNKLASLLNASRDLIPIYHQIKKIFYLPTAKEISSAKSALIGLSNIILKSPNGKRGDSSDRRYGYEKEIRDAINIQEY